MGWTCGCAYSCILRVSNVYVFDGRSFMSKVVSGRRPGVSRETSSSQPPSRPAPSVLRATVDKIIISTNSLRHPDLGNRRNTIQHFVKNTISQNTLSLLLDIYNHYTFEFYTYNINRFVFYDVIN